ncbi:trypsin-like serine peptidase [Streptomyces sp. 12297]
MAQAEPLDANRDQPTTSLLRSGSEEGPEDGPPAGTPTATHFEGLPMVGTFFFQGVPVSGDATYCSGSVVRSRGKNMVLTAGHCGQGLRKAVHRIFVPQYRYGQASADQPWGVYPLTDVYIDNRYENNTREAVSDLDFAFVLVGKGPRGKVEDVTGALTLTTSTSYEHNVTVVGYPSKDKVNNSHRAIRCDVRTKRLYGFRQMRMACSGYYGGVSGGPWIRNYDPRTGTGEVIGNVGGVGGGGDDHWISYAPVYGQDALDLYNDAGNDIGEGKVNRTRPYKGPDDGPLLPGGGATWKHAKQIASGDFRGTGHSDLLVLWTDGEVTLYPGDGSGGFGKERQLLAPNATWKTAARITAGDFTGANQFDLLVRWDNGRLSLHGDVAANGLGGSGTQMAPAGSVWSHATQIAAGRFNAQTYVTDLMVRWSDGELTLYTNVSAGTLGQEHKLKAPNTAWKDATLLTSGQFSGNQKWDLMVRWTNGALDNYVGTTTAGLGSQKQVQGPNKTWTHSVIMTTGEYTGDGLANDLVIRWSDGETTMYRDTRTTSLGTERMLVPPA